MAGGEPRLGTTATYMRHNDHGTTRLSTEIDILHDLINDEYRVFSAGSVRKWSKFGLKSDRHGLRYANVLCSCIDQASSLIWPVGRDRRCSSGTLQRREPLAWSPLG